MTTLLSIFAHPDDEGAIAGALAHYADCGVDVSLICATRGEAGQISDPSLATQETIGEVREAELRAACEILGIGELRFLDYRDSGMQGTPENEDPRALIQADPQEVIDKIVAHLRELRPDVVITFEPFGWYGHPDHIAVSRLATEAYEQVENAATNSEDGHSWRPQRLYHAVLPLSMFESMTDYAREHGFLDENEDEFEPQDAQREAEERVTHVLDFRTLVDVKLNAMWVHRTQFGSDHWFTKLPHELLQEQWGQEYFIQVRPTPATEHISLPGDELLP